MRSCRELITTKFQLCVDPYVMGTLGRKTAVEGLGDLISSMRVIILYK
jgi:hypothetical protein